MTILTTDIAEGVAALRRGGLVAFPTETVYGLGADAADPEAVRAVFAAKGRPLGHPLIAHVASADRIGPWARLSAEVADQVERLARAFWPGPLTIVVPSSGQAAPEMTGGRPTIGLRVPDHPIATALLAAFDGAVAAPSANRFGRVSPTTASHVVDDLDGLVDVVIDGGPTAVGIESTIVEVLGSEPVLLRPGAVGLTDLEAALGRAVKDGGGEEARAPGMLQSHYAPDATIELVSSPAALREAVAEATASRPDGSVVGVVAPVAANHQPSWLLPADAADYAARLYSTLREADRLGVAHLLIVPPTGGTMLDAVVDRLTKAAAPR